MLRFLTAGESHGPGLTAIIEGMPAGIEVSVEELRRELARRRKCYGRGGRALIENDEVHITAGVHGGRTTGAPIGVLIPNKDYSNWQGKHRPITAPRPGHADLAGAIKYGFEDCRPVAERASARETAARVACGYFAKKLLSLAGVEVVSWVTQIGPSVADLPPQDQRMYDPQLARKLAQLAETSEVRCPDPVASANMAKLIDAAREAGDTLGGVFEVAALGVPPGLGSYVHWDRRLDAKLAAAVISIPGVKGVEIGLGFAAAPLYGSQVHDHITLTEPNRSRDPRALGRKSNNAGGIEGGVSNGQIVFLRAVMKPIPTLQSPLPSVDLATGEQCDAHRERSDICAVGSAAVVAEAMVAIVLADALLEARGGDKW